MVTSTRTRPSERFLRTSSPLSRRNARLPDSPAPDGADCVAAGITRWTGHRQRWAGPAVRSNSSRRRRRPRAARRANRSKRHLQRRPRRRAGLEFPFQAGHEQAPVPLKTSRRCFRGKPRVHVPAFTNVASKRTLSSWPGYENAHPLRHRTQHPCFPRWRIAGFAGMSGRRFAHVDAPAGASGSLAGSVGCVASVRPSGRRRHRRIGVAAVGALSFGRRGILG
jgi:hypothetical protein